MSRTPHQDSQQAGDSSALEDKLREEVYRLAELRLAGRLSFDEQAHLIHLVAHRPEAAQFYVEFMSDTATLYDLSAGVARAAEAAAIVPPETNAQPSKAAAGTPAQAAPAPVISRDPSSAIQHLFRPIILLLVAAISSVAGFSIWAISGFQLPGQHVAVAPPPPAPERPASQRQDIVATLTRTRGAAWAAGMPSTKTDSEKQIADKDWRLTTAPASIPLRAGQELGLSVGLAEIQFAGGARVTLEGPARFKLETKGSGRLGVGKLVAYAPRPARGFTIHTPDGVVVDEGTEFGVWVKQETSGDHPSGQAKAESGEQSEHVATSAAHTTTEVHVFQGVVDAGTNSAPSEVRRSNSKIIAVGAGQAVRISAEVGDKPQPIASDAGGFVRSIDTALGPGEVVIGEVADSGSKELVRMLKNGGQICSFPNPLDLCGQLAFAPDGSGVYAVVRHARRSWAMSVWRIDVRRPDQVTIIVDKMPIPTAAERDQGDQRGRVGLAVESNGMVLVARLKAEDHSGQIWRVKLGGGDILTNDLPALVNSIVVAPRGDIFASVDRHYVAKIDPTTGASVPLIKNIDPGPLALDPTTGDLFVSNRMQDFSTEIHRYRPDGTDLGRVSLLPDMSTRPEAQKEIYHRAVLCQLAVEPTGTLLAAYSRGGGLWRIDPKNGQRTLLRQEGEIQGVAIVPTRKN